MVQTITGIAGWRAVEGQELGWSDWKPVTQEMIDDFAGLTGDHQWIHVDPKRAAEEGPFGGTIAHGYLTVSLGPALAAEVFAPEGFSMALNYGSNKTRFPAPVRSGKKVRLGIKVSSVTDIPGNGVEVVKTFTTEVEGEEKPACVTQLVVRYYEAEAA